MSTGNEQDVIERIYVVVGQVPPGKVTTYGEVATIVGGGSDARFVGQALGMLGDRASKVPWQRVLSRGGVISTYGGNQRELLGAEGIEFDEKGKVPMDRFRWSGPEKEWAEQHGFQTLPSRGGDKKEEDKSQLSLL